MNTRRFIDRQVEEIQREVGSGIAINALSGGVDSSTVTVLAHRALGRRLKTVFVDNALMREGEPERVLGVFRKMRIPVERIDARRQFLKALARITDPEQKRQAVTDTFYRVVLARAVRRARATTLLHGTILTDIEETVAGIKRQHNILAQVGIDPQEAYGYKVVEPLKTLRKDGVRRVARALGLPATLTERIPFPGPALAARIVGEVTAARLKTVRAATTIVEKELGKTGAFQYFAVLLNDRATGIRGGRREFGEIVVVRCIDSRDARVAKVRALPWTKLHRLARLITGIPGVNRCLYDLTPKPPATVEYI
jgi:GMP synthase (glutamine-hydrolysing)